MKKYIILLLLLILVAFFLYINNNNRVMHVSQVESYQATGKNVDNKENIKLLTYNIRHGVGVDGRLDLDRIVEVIKYSGAEIIGLNEVDYLMRRSGFRNQVGYIAEKLGMNYAFGASEKQIAGSYGNAILSRYPIVRVENHELPSLVDKKMEKRALIKSKIKISDDKSIYVLSTHLSLNCTERSKQIIWLEKFLSVFSEPYILMGDFNTEIDEINYVLNENDITSSALIPIPVLLQRKTYPSVNPVKGVDMYFSSLSFEVKDSHTINTTASDHLPVYLEVEFAG
ncbi:MAG: endonuclease/exonuclease/phosphatase family protein [Halanaerobiales bacterium]